MSGRDPLCQDIVFVYFINLHVRLPKVAYFYVPRLTDQDIERLQITVNYALTVQESDTIHDFIYNVLDLINAYHVTPGSNEIHQILLAVFKNEV